MILNKKDMIVQGLPANNPKQFQQTENGYNLEMYHNIEKLRK